jgi:hypothetical protein
MLKRSVRTFALKDGIDGNAGPLVETVSSSRHLCALVNASSRIYRSWIVDGMINPVQSISPVARTERSRYFSSESIAASKGG